MDLGDMLKQRMAMNDQIMQMNLQNATLDTDFTNPMVFNVALAKEREKNGEHLP